MPAVFSPRAALSRRLTAIVSVRFIADDSRLVLASDVLATSNDSQDFAPFIDQLFHAHGKPQTLLADAGYGSKAIVEGLQRRGIEPPIAVTRHSEPRAYDFRPPSRRHGASR